jgi:hypothetical protein
MTSTPRLPGEAKVPNLAPASPGLIFMRRRLKRRSRRWTLVDLDLWQLERLEASDTVML